MKTSLYSRPHREYLHRWQKAAVAMGFDCKLGRAKLTITAPVSAAEFNRRREESKKEAVQ